jgi:regulating synaptic membrane exocytosis protein 2
LPILPDGPLGDFIDDLGPGQVVGRQVLASPVLGEIQIGLGVKRGNLEVEIIRARNLMPRGGSKTPPGKYIILWNNNVNCIFFQHRM